MGHINIKNRLLLPLGGFIAMPFLMALCGNLLVHFSKCYEFGCLLAGIYGSIAAIIIDTILVISLYMWGCHFDKRASSAKIDHLAAIAWGFLLYIVTIVVSIYLQRFF